MEFSLFIGGILAVLLVFTFVFWLISSHRSLRLPKKSSLEEHQCDICMAVYFISLFAKYWRCPFCGSINKKKTK